MLALKKKKQEAAAAAAAAVAESTSRPDDSNGGAPAQAVEGKTTKKESLFGIGGEKKKSGANGKEKRRTAGEIRIQKGNVYKACIRLTRRKSKFLAFRSNV